MVKSKLWDAQEALYNLVAGAVTLHPRESQVTIGNPTDLVVENVWVSGQVDDWNMDHRVSGLGSKDEEFTLRVSIAVKNLGPDYLPARNRVREIAQDVEDAIAGNPHLGGIAELAKITSMKLEDTMLDERHRAVGISLFVSVRTWLTS